MNKSILILLATLIANFTYAQKVQVKYNENTRKSYFVNAEGKPLSKEDFATIWRLDLSRQNIKVLPKEITDFDNLRLLNLSHNQLTTLPSELGKLVGLNVLNLSYNKFEELSEQVKWYRFRDFESLDLSHNRLKSLPKNLWELYDLVSLDLSHNQLDSIPTEIFKFIELKNLNISHNKLSKILPYLKEMPKMETLNFEGNPLDEELSEEDKKITFAYLAKKEKFVPEENMVKLEPHSQTKIVLKLGQKMYFQEYESASLVGGNTFLEFKESGIVEKILYHKEYDHPQIHRSGYTGTTGGTATTVYEAKKVGKTKLIVKYSFANQTHKYPIRIIVKL